ncbi:MAG: NADH:ubiquinone oxidoreductase subunit [Rickettsiaceae bacterium]|jgi:NADH:ubiquinone oxidoreductase subunit|nr:NADH:ubiquinone oxidoreductase subunit [Rickettsiaceae bacterium]
MSLINKLYIKFTSQFIGEDEYGHRYYLSKKECDYLGKKKRYVIYNGSAEPSKIPPMWHAWLHYLSDSVPLKGKIKNYKWQKEHTPNLTGTVFAYFPSGDPKKNVKRKQVSSDYESWQPKE